MFMSCWDTGPLCPEVGCGNTLSQKRQGLLCQGLLKKGKPGCTSLLASKQSLQLVLWRQAQPEPPTALGRSLNVLGYSTHQALPVRLCPAGPA